MAYSLSILVLMPIAAGIIIYLNPARFRSFISILVQTGHLAVSLYCLMQSRIEPVVFNIGGWLPPVGISLYADSIAMSFVVISSFLFLMFIIYNANRHYTDRMFYMLFLSLQGFLAAIFLLDDLFSIFVLMEVSTIVVSLLIMFKRDSRSIYDGMIYLLINAFAMTFFLLGISILYKITGTFSIRLIKEVTSNVTDTRSLYLTFAFIITSVSLKAALMPLFSWLPKAHGTPSAPSVVSGVLSGLYVKGGVYLFLRISNAFSVLDVSGFFLVCGIITAILGIVLAVCQTDIKLLLSYSTVSQLGLIMMAFNLGGDYAVYGGFYHILSHALFKSALFLCAGIIIDRYKTRDINQMQGVFKTLPVVSLVCMVSILAITGAPLFNGSISKYLIGKSTESYVIDWVFSIINLGTLVYYVKFTKIFPGPKHKRTGLVAMYKGEDVEKVSLNRKLVLAVLGVLCLLGGLFGEIAIEFLYVVDIKINPETYIEKSMIFVLSIFCAIALYKLGLTNNKVTEKIRKFDADFNNIALSIPVFFVSVLTYLFLS